jgi:hypothetical protein
MKKILAILLVGFAFAFTGCNDDDPKPYYVGVATITSLENGLTLATDNDNVLFGDDEGTASKLTVGQRVYFGCTEIRTGQPDEGFNYLVNYDYIDPLKTKDIQTLNDVSRDTIGNDWITVNSSWVKNQYMNVYFSYGAYNQKHYVNLVYDPQNQTKQDTVILELRHQANNDYQNSSASAIFCFDLSSFEWAGTPPHKFVMRYKNYNSKIVDVKNEYTPPTQAE